MPQRRIEPHPLRPVTFRDWKSLYHQAAKELGWMVSHRFKNGHLHIDRDLYREIRRMKRIDERMQIESEAMDATWCEEVYRMIFRGKP